LGSLDLDAGDEFGKDIVIELDRIVAIRSPGVLLAPSPHSNAHLAEECQSILSKMIALLLYQLAGKISILRPGRDRIHQGILICLNSICRVADRWVFPANKNARRKP
jgi:hypothetical protein